MATTKRKTRTTEATGQFVVYQVEGNRRTVILEGEKVSDLAKRLARMVDGVDAKRFAETWNAFSPTGSVRYELAPVDQRLPALPLQPLVMRSVASSRVVTFTPPAATSAPVLERVKQAMASAPHESRWGEKVYISDLWHLLGGDSFTPLHAFKSWLIEQNREGTLQLSRADLPSKMDLTKVSESEIESMRATFHFVRDPSAPSRRY